MVCLPFYATQEAMRFTTITLDAQFVALRLVVLLLPAMVKMTGRHIQISSAKSAVRKSTGVKQSGRIYTATNGGNMRKIEIQDGMDKVCPECGFPIMCECVIGSDESLSGLTERLYSCRKCGSAWSTQENNGEESVPQRYFFG
jgi:hypothetical protein